MLGQHTAFIGPNRREVAVRSELWAHWDNRQSTFFGLHNAGCYICSTAIGLQLPC